MNSCEDNNIALLEDLCVAEDNLAVLRGNKNKVQRKNLREQISKTDEAITRLEKQKQDLIQKNQQIARPYSAGEEESKAQRHRKVKEVIANFEA